VTHGWPRAAVFDFDGLLVDTARCWHQAYTNALALSGRRLDPALTKTLAGASISTAATRLDVAADDLRSLLVASFAEQRLLPLPGATELVRRLRRRALLAVATNAPRSLVSAALQQVGLLDSFDLILSAETQPREKPAPDVYCAACAELGIDPADAIAFEDSPTGVLAARCAGLVVVYVPSDGQEADADLQVGRLDDPRLLTFLDGAVRS
jgi:HAD superfamily hydrolase (TIGR01509 family)